MDIKRARLYALSSFWAALFMLSITLLFAITLSFQSYHDGRGGGLNVLAQFLSSPMKGINLAVTSPFDKGVDYIDNDMDRKLIEETLARYYLEMRYTFFPDSKEMQRRWGWMSPLVRISSPDLHKTLARDDLEDIILDKHNVETVNVVKMYPSTSRPRQYIAEIEINSISEQGEFASKMFRVTMDFNYSRSYQSFFRDPINPYGLYFYRVSIKPM